MPYPCKKFRQNPFTNFSVTVSDGQTDRPTDKQTKLKTVSDGQTDRPTDKQTKLKT